MSLELVAIDLGKQSDSLKKLDTSKNLSCLAGAGGVMEPPR
ncbi:MAG TPA: hypothetical protein VHL31_03130 [Geminicoccus sp.]|nr:hypothetical protein [Geminicoccus sp.]HEX2525279.1 hypothetical protein [Geminicoccus sp.]